MLESVINNKIIKVEFDGKQVKVNDEPHPFDILPIQEGKYFHLLYRQHSYYFEVLGYDKDSKIYKIGFNGRTYEVGIKDRFDQLLHSMGLDSVSKPRINEVKAPMPGLVLSIKVSEGMEVKKGDPLLILEAMKMENVIKSPADGSVKSISVRERQAVDKNETLITFN